MLQTLGNLFSLDNRAVQIVLAAIVLVVLFAVAAWVYRTIFAHRLRTPGAARGRAPRLGVVDVFTLDAQRQLVIVRRDNVEHLLMIGGPNDLVVEPQIVRGALANGAGREAAKAAPAEPVVEPSAPPRPAAPPPPAARRIPPRSVEVPPPVAPAPAPEPAPAPVKAAEPVVVAARPVEVVPEPKTAVEPLRKPVVTPRPVPARPNLPSPIVAPRAPEAPVEPSKPAAEAAKAPQVSIAPPLAPIAPAPPPLATPAAAVEKPRPRADDAFYDLESLEAEMARLLGRE
jgi:flagellar protein FliO/FliZ